MAKRRAVIGPGEARIAQLYIAVALDGIALNAAGAGDEALHQIAVARLDVGFEQADAARAKPPTRLAQVALALEIEPVDRVALQRAKPERAAFDGKVRQPRSKVGIVADEADRLLVADNSTHRAAFGRDPIDQLQPLVPISPPVSTPVSPLPRQQKARDRSATVIAHGCPAGIMQDGPVWRCLVIGFLASHPRRSRQVRAPLRVGRPCRSARR